MGAGLRAELRGAVAQDLGRLAQLRDRQEEQGARERTRSGRLVRISRAPVVLRVRSRARRGRRVVVRGLGAAVRTGAPGR